MDILSLIAFIIYTVLFAFVVVSHILLVAKYKKLSKENNQGKLDRIMLIAKMAEIIQESESKGVEQTDGFLRFVSESRDWAFQYIEDVQNAIKILSETPKADRAEYNKAYKKVLSFLPEDIKDS